MASPTDFLSNLELLTEDGVAHPIWGRKIFQHIDGVGLPAIRRITQRTPLQHGVLDKGFRLEPRQMTMTFFFSADTTQAVDTIRDEFAYLFGPTNTALKLRFTRRDNTIRQIDCYVDGLVDFPMSLRTGADQQVIVPLLASDPTFYNPTQQTSSMVLVNGVNNDIDITPTGLTADDWPVIDLTGPLTTCQIQHVPGDELLRLSSAIPGGETFRIDLRPGYKTVRRTSDNANRLSYINTNDISSFSLMRVLGEKTMKTLNSSSTVNKFRSSSVTGATGATTISILWYKRHLSL